MLPVVAVGDTTYLDYKQIIAKRDGYGPIGNGGGLILHTNLAVEPLQDSRWAIGRNSGDKAKPPRMKPQAEKPVLAPSAKPHEASPLSQRNPGFEALEAVASC